MSGLVLWSLKILFTENARAEFVSDWMDKLFETLYSIIIENEFVNDAINIFGGIASALAVLLLLTDMTINLQRETLSFEKFLALFIRTFIIGVLLMSISDIMKGGFLIGYNLYEYNKNHNLFENVKIASTTNDNGTESFTSYFGYTITYNPDAEKYLTYETQGSADNYIFNFAGVQWDQAYMEKMGDDFNLDTPIDENFTITNDPCDMVTASDLAASVGESVANSYATTEQLEEQSNAQTQENADASNESPYGNIREALASHYTKPTRIIQNLHILNLIIPGLIMLLIKIACAFIATGNAITILVKMIFMPIPIVRIFDEGMRSSGLRYIRGFIADCITMGIILVMINAGDALTQALLLNSSLSACGYVISCNTLGDILDFQGLLMLALPDLAVLVGLASANKIANQVVGN